MKTRRLFALFLVLCLALPIGALAERVMTGIRVQILTGVNEDGSPMYIDAMEGMDYSVDRYDAYGTEGLWIKINNPMYVNNAVRVYVKYAEDGFEHEYALYNPASMDPSMDEWLDLSGSEMMPATGLMMRSPEGLPEEVFASPVTVSSQSKAEYDNQNGGDNGGDGGDNGGDGGDNGGDGGDNGGDGGDNGGDGGDNGGDGGDNGGNGGDNGNNGQNTYDPDIIEEHPNSYAAIGMEGGSFFPDTYPNNVSEPLAPGTVVKYIENDNRYPEYTDPATGQKWLPVWLGYDENARFGYVAYREIGFLTNDDLQTYFNQIKPLQTPPSDHGSLAGSDYTLYNENLQRSGSLPSDAVLIYDTTRGYIRDGDGNIYVYVKDDKSGTAGYIPMTNVSFWSASEAQTYEDDKNKPTASPVPTAMGTARYAYGTEANLVVYKEPGGSYMTTISAGEGFIIVGLKKAADGEYYHEIVLQKGDNYGKTAYLPYDYARLMTADEEAAWKAANPTPSPIPTETATATATATTTATATATATTTVTPDPTPQTQFRGYMIVNTANYAGVYVQSNYGAPVDFLQRGDMVFAENQMYANGVMWTQALPMKDGGKAGYMVYADLRAATAAEIKEYFSDKPTTPPTPTPLPTYSPSSFSGYGMLTSNSVNFRSAASSTSSVITRLAKGTIVRVLSQTTADGYTWYRCESNGTTGYLRSDMLALLSIREYELVVSSPSYNQNGNIITPTATAKPNNSITWSTQSPNATQGITFVTIPPISTASATATIDPSATPTIDPLASPTSGATDDPMIGMMSPSPSPDESLLPTIDPEFPQQESGGSSISGIIIALVVLLVLVAGGMYGYSLYNKARRKQFDEQAKRLASQARGTKPGTPGDGKQPAVRRPVPPTQPGASGSTPQQPGKQGSTPTAGRPGTPGQNASGTAAAPQRPGTPGQPGANPYARPQSAQPRVQDVTSPMPRAQVDGKPVGSGAQQNPYARPQGTTPQQPTAGNNNGGAATPGKAPSGTTTPGQAQQPRMPVAPPPVQPDGYQQTEGDSAEAPRRRRRRYTEGEQPTENNKDNGSNSNA